MVPGDASADVGNDLRLLDEASANVGNDLRLLDDASANVGNDLRLLDDTSANVGNDLRLLCDASANVGRACDCSMELSTMLTTKMILIDNNTLFLEEKYTEICIFRSKVLF